MLCTHCMQPPKQHTNANTQTTDISLILSGCIRTQGDAQFSDAVQAAADAYRQERDTKGPASAMRVWEDHKAYIDMTFMPKSQSSLKARF
jgi:hypothetical protein